MERAGRVDDGPAAATTPTATTVTREGGGGSTKKGNGQHRCIDCTRQRVARRWGTEGHTPLRAPPCRPRLSSGNGQSTRQQVGAGHHPRLTPVCVLSHAPPPPLDWSGGEHPRGPPRADGFRPPPAHRHRQPVGVHRAWHRPSVPASAAGDTPSPAPSRTSLAASRPRIHTGGGRAAPKRPPPRRAGLPRPTPPHRIAYLAPHGRFHRSRGRRGGEAG